jgi:hypothetical protein
MTEAGYESLPAQRMLAVNLSYPLTSWDSAKSGLGQKVSHHLNTSVECTVVNVGGSGMDAKVSSPPMTYQSVGAVIVLGGRESRLQGEGPQGIDIRQTK